MPGIAPINPAPNDSTRRYGSGGNRGEVSGGASGKRIANQTPSAAARPKNPTSQGRQVLPRPLKGDRLCGVDAIRLCSEPMVGATASGRNFGRR